MSSAPVPMSPESGDLVQLENALRELRDTEANFHRDLNFVLEEVRPIITQDRELLFGGLQEIHEFSVAIHKDFINIVAIQGLTQM